ncbi:MAG: hypothetical protein ABFS10_14630 [Bacteroidota bacterium]
MKPLRIFIFLTTVALWLFMIALIFPRQGISITPDFQLKFIDLSTLTDKETASKDKLVEQMVAASMVTADPEEGFDPGGVTITETTGVTGGPGAAGEVIDTGGISIPLVSPANADSLKRAVCRIRFSEGGSGLLDPFFFKLKGLLDGSVARSRIMHFGDSQIENDRMTALIRYRLQRQFGGSGAGLVPAIPLYWGNLAYEQEEEGDWMRHTFFGSRDSLVTHNAYGVMGAFASVPMSEEESRPRIQYRFNTSRRTGRFDRVRLFMHSYVEGASMAVVVNDTLTDSIRNLPDGFSVADYRHHAGVKELSLSMDFPEGGRIYGISFESYLGLQMDNIAMRGGSGLIFTKMNRELQLRMFEILSPGLIILQYGGNVVPYITPGFYQRAFKRELALIRELCPGVPVIVIGPSDMSMKEKGKFVTYPGLEPVRDALKNAALESGFAFWDLYEAMGGYNSMASFVHADPPLAFPDYVHFTPVGVNLVAEMFYNALMVEYNSYSSQNR